MKRNRFGDISTRSRESYNALCEAQDRALHAPTTMNCEAVSVATRQWKLFSEAEEKFYYQKSRVTWMANGDHNTAFFHNTVKSRNAKNAILSLTSSNGSQLTDLREINKEAVAFFKDLLNDTPANCSTPIPDLSDVISFRCSNEQVSFLTGPITVVDIKAALDSLPSNKASGPDGFTAEFFKATWRITGKDFIMAVQSFFVFQYMPNGTNATVLSLIPKIDNPETMRDFRPIACCNVLYKVISKILANRLQTILPQAIEPNQSAFIKGRLLLENVLLATKLVKDYHKSSISSRCAIKFDISKAFDTIRWDIILETLKTMAVPDLFISWIRGCITTAAFSVSINGDTDGFFTSSRGIRQGCALSPYLFDIVNNVLSLLINKAASQGLIDYHPKCSEEGLTHLSFADDIMVFTNGSKKSLQGISNVLTYFAEISGLKVNLSKSAIYFAGNISQESRAEAISMGILQGHLPVRYLGLPLTTKNMTKSDYEPLVDRIRNRFLSWTNRFLSYAGRLMLIKSVIASTANFWCSVFRLPQGCLDKIEGMCAAFLWSGSPHTSNKAKVRWEDVCMSKKEGGLGIRKLRDTSLVFSLSLIWRLLSFKGSLWVSWTRRYLLRYSSFWDVKLGSSGSWIWRKLLKLRPLAFNFMKINIRDGSSTFFWHDRWLGNESLLNRLGEHAIQTLGISRQASVSDAANEGNWRFRRCRGADIQAVLAVITQLPPPRMEAGLDEALWRHGNDDYKSNFSSTATWNQLRQQRQDKPWHCVVWFPYAIPRYGFITWLALLDRLSTGVRTRVWGLHQPCLFCGELNEDRDHLFFGCPYSFTVWNLVARRILGRTINPDWHYTLSSLLSARRKPEDKVISRILYQSSIYFIWRERNYRRHRQTPKTASSLAHSIAKATWLRIHSRQTVNRETTATLIVRWNEVKPQIPAEEIPS